MNFITRNSTRTHRVDTHWSQLTLSSKPRGPENRRERLRIDWCEVGWWAIPAAVAVAVIVLILVLGPLDARPL